MTFSTSASFMINYIKTCSMAPTRRRTSVSRSNETTLAEGKGVHDRIDSRRAIHWASPSSGLGAINSVSVSIQHWLLQDRTLFYSTPSIQTEMSELFLDTGVSTTKMCLDTSISRYILLDRGSTLVLTCLSKRITTYYPFKLRGLLRISLVVILIFLTFMLFHVPRQLRHNKWPILSFLLVVLFILSVQVMYSLRP
jgi:hypothetical protein